MNTEIRIEGQSSDESFDFSVHHEGQSIPATFWSSRLQSGGGTPLVLLQHGGPFHKRHEHSNALAETIVERTGAAVLLIDGPIHGRRRTDTAGVEEMLAAFEQHWRENPGIDQMVSDWRTALDAVLQQRWADPNRVVWFGMSMGTAYGIPLCAAETRIKAAAIGMWGTDWGQGTSLFEHAGQMQTPALFQIKSEDEIFSLEGQRKLFDAIGSPDKCLHTFAGGHSMTAPGQLDQLLEFIIQALTSDQEASVDTK
tara:strand:+ start:16327 stop:17088 length:762 start_codon:yes stop_codon:yes gene_type:complete